MARQPRRILIVDDLPDWCATIGRLLTDEGYRVCVAESADKALTLLTKTPVDLAVVDIRLDDSDEANVQGLDLADQIKRDWPAVQVIILTGYPTLHTVERVMQPRGAGSRCAEAYVEKDRPDELVKMVRQALAT